MRNIKLLLVVLFAFLALASNGFAATITVDIATDNSNVGNLNQDGNGPCSLREAIQNANNDAATSDDCQAGSGDDIIVFSGVSSITLVAEIFVTSNIEIRGAGNVTISGGDSTPMFVVASSTGHLTLQQLTIQNGSTSGAGGAIRTNVDTKLTCDRSLFKNNKADGTGGAISADGTVDIDLCSFENNTAGSDGGAIHKGSGYPLTINESNFAQNKAGILVNGQTNANGGDGGAIHFVSPSVIEVANITGSRFNMNEANNGNGGMENGGGGAIAVDGIMNITGSVFAGNQAKGPDWHGGAIWSGSSATLSVNYSHFGTTPLPLPAPFNTLTEPNRANGQRAIGGAIYNIGELLVLGSSFIGNMSSTDGGAFANVSTADDVQIANSTFSSNVAGARGGAIYTFRSDALVTLTNVTIANNTAVTQGGGIYNNGDGDNDGILNDEILLHNTVVASNSAAIGSNCAGGTVASDGLNDAVFPPGVDCPNAPAVTGDPGLGNAELTFSIPNAVTYALPPGTGSSLLGTGSAAVCANFPILNLDQRAFPRPQGDPICDIGSYESSNIGATPTPTRTATATVTATPTNTATPTITATATNSPTVTPTVVPPTNTSTPTPTPTFVGPTNTPTNTPTSTPTNVGPTTSPTNTPTSSPTPTITNTATSSPTPTITNTVTNSPTPTITHTPTSSPTTTVTPNITVTSGPTATATNTATPSNTPTNTPVITATNTATPTNTAIITVSVTATPTSSATPIEPTVTPEPTIPSETTPTAIPTTSPVPTTASTPGTNDLGCQTIQIQGIQLQADGQGAAQLRLVRKARALVLNANATRTQRSTAKRLVTDAAKTYQLMWEQIWGYQPTIVSCSNTVLCSTVDISGNVKAFQAGSQKMTSLLNQTVKILKKATGRSSSGSSLVKSMTKLHKSNLAASAQIPTTRSDCSLPPA